MNCLKGKNVLLGICAGIAAYKIPSLIRLLVKQGASVRVIVTEDAKQFVTELTLSVLSKNEVFSSFTDQRGNWNSHVELAMWADVMVIAPATANTISKMACAMSDNLLMATYLSCKAKVLVAPAMDLDMYAHPGTRENIKKLESFGNTIIPCGVGELASGLSGEGRMAEVEEILNYISKEIGEEKPLAGKKVMITAGPTYEMIDPVRFVGNFSTGKMGIALANKANQLGAEVTLILGPVYPQKIEQGVKVVKVVSAQDMHKEANDIFEQMDIAILSAAVADYTPVEKAPQKIKKNEGKLILELTKTKDVLASLGERKIHQKLIGFALETENEIDNAKGKIKKKNLDAVVLNSLNDKGAGFGTDTNKVTFITKDMKEFPIELKPKIEVALDILNLIIKECK